MCQSCVNEGHLKQETLDAIDGFLGEWPDAEFGPAHVVLSDCNIDNGCIEWCLRLIEALLDASKIADLEEEDICLLGKCDNYRDHGHDEFVATQKFLQGLLAVPEDER